MIQSFAQINKSYGKEGAEIIIHNCQDTLFGRFVPNSPSAGEEQLQPVHLEDTIPIVEAFAYKDLLKLY